MMPNLVLQEKHRIFLYCVCFTRVRVIFLKFILKLRVYSEEILDLDILSVTASLNR